MVSTITGADSIAGPTSQMLSSCGAVATIVLLILLTIRELAAASQVTRFQLLGRNPYVAAVPLLFVFCLILAISVL